MAFCLGWIYRRSASRESLLSFLFRSRFNGLVWLFSAVFFASLAWYRRKKRAELMWLVSLGQSSG